MGNLISFEEAFEEIVSEYNISKEHYHNIKNLYIKSIEILVDELDKKLAYSIYDYYYYITYKICQYLGYSCYTTKVIKSLDLDPETIEEIIHLDSIWKNICLKLKIPFIKTICPILRPLINIIYEKFNISIHHKILKEHIERKVELNRQLYQKYRFIC